MLNHLVGSVNALLPEPHASLLAGMLFGVRATMPDDFYEALIITGTLHVIALSGMNVSIIIRLLFGIMGKIFGKTTGLVLTITGIVGFVFLVGPSATIIRASIMGSLTLIALWFGRKDIPLLSLVFTVLIMILLNHDLISSISFQLSVFATLGIILFAGKEKFFVKNVWSGIWWFIKDNLRVTLSAQIFTTPLILFYFNRVSIISPFANVAIGWLIGPITYLGFMTVFLAQIWWPLGRFASLIVWVPLSFFIWIVKTFSQIPFASIEF